MGTALLLFNATLTTGKVVTSWPAEIQVFEALRLDPKNITLLPTATFQIRSFGGPAHQTSIIYSIDNSTTASVDQSGLITASVPGNAIVTGTARSVEGSGDSSSIANSNVVYSSDTVKVKVVKLTGIRIVVPSTKLVAEEEVAVYAQGLDEDETPFTFGSVTPGLTFHWSVSNMDVLSLVSVYDQAGVSLQEERDFASRLRTRNPGRGVIRVTVKCPPGVCIPDEGIFSDDVNIRVFPPLKLINPANGRLRIPQNGVTTIKTNRDGSTQITYSLVQSCAQEEQPVISLGPNGEINSNGFNGHAVVMVTANELDLGVNQTVLVHCEVGAISSLTLSAVSPAKATPHSKEHAFPLGYSATFAANLHDSIGRQFDYANVDLSYRLNRFDIVHVTRGSDDQGYIVKAAKQGNAIFKVWVSDDPSISDYIRVRVGYAIIPSQATVHLGAKICFTTHLTEQSHPGKWSTSEGTSVLSMSADSGVAMATGTGRTVVYHKIGGVVDTLTEISVATIKRVVYSLSPDASSLPIFTNAPVHEDRADYLIPVEFKDEHNDTDFTQLVSSLSEECLNEHKSQDSVFLQQIAFQCVLELSNGHEVLTASKYISTESYFDDNTGKSYCRLLPSGNDSGGLAVLPELRLVLKVKASDYQGTYNVWSRGLEIPFLPAFTADRSEVLLSHKEPSVTVKVTGLMKVLNTIQPSSPYPLTVTRQSMMGTSATYLISFTDPKTPPTQAFNDTHVTLLNTLTHQKLVILVSYTGITEPLDSASCHAPNEEGVSPIDKGYLNEEQWNLVFAGTACLILLLATIVVGLALRQSSQKVNDGFSSKLPPPKTPNAPTTPGAAFTSATPTRSPMATPIWSTSQQTQSAFKRTPHPTTPHTTTTRTSPQHNLFSQ